MNKRKLTRSLPYTPPRGQFAEALAKGFGYMTPGEVALLKQTCAGLRCSVNIGAGVGTSTIAMLECGLEVWSVDITQKGAFHGLDSERHMVTQAGLRAGYHWIVGDSRTIPWAHGPIDIVFVDGDHAGVVEDIVAWRPRVRDFMAFHDYGNDLFYATLKPAVDRAMQDCERIAHVDTLGVFRV